MGVFTQPVVRTVGLDWVVEGRGYVRRVGVDDELVIGLFSLDLIVYMGIVWGPGEGGGGEGNLVKMI